MTIEFWPRSLLKPRKKSHPAVRKRRSRRPKLPIRIGKAHQVLSTAIICGDHELASWLDLAVKTDRVVGTPEALEGIAAADGCRDGAAAGDASAPDCLIVRRSGHVSNPNSRSRNPQSMTTTLLEQPAVRPSTSPSQRLRTTMAAVRVAISWLGVRKTLTPEQKTIAADSFGAEGNFLSAGKKLLDTTHPAFKAVTAVRGRIVVALEVDVAALPGARHPLDPAGRHRHVQRQDGVAQAGARRGRPAAWTGTTPS